LQGGEIELASHSAFQGLGISFRKAGGDGVLLEQLQGQPQIFRFAAELNTVLDRANDGFMQFLKLLGEIALGHGSQWRCLASVSRQIKSHRPDALLLAAAHMCTDGIYCNCNG
jgi:hypothetical protein